jgi:hypothetical protein
MVCLLDEQEVERSQSLTSHALLRGVQRVRETAAGKIIVKVHINQYVALPNVET